MNSSKDNINKVLESGKGSDNEPKPVNSKKTRKRMPVWMLVATDILLAAFCLGIFSLYEIVLPHKLKSEALVVASAKDMQDNNFELPSFDNEDSQAVNASGNVTNTPDKDNSTGQTTDSTSTDKPSRRARTGDFTNYSNTGTDNLSADDADSEAFSAKEKVITEINSYQSDKLQFTTDKIEIGSGNDKITYYLSDIYVTNVKYLKTAFASGTYGKNMTDSAANMAVGNNALLAISGDYYGNSENSVVIRNGILYRSTGNDADVCVIFTDGTMKTYAPEDFDADEVISQGAWQAWTFGPALLDASGNIPDSFNTTDYLYENHPRSAIGYVEPGHFVFVVVDGRSPGYSRGANVNELAQIMIDAGCVAAYNLDGGKSASMVYDGEYVNVPAQGGRDISDIIYLGE
jgi:exopolysaccharide biosynthesis protein